MASRPVDEIDPQTVQVQSRSAASTATATRKYATELIGTFILVFTVGTTAFAKAPLGALAVGGALMVMVYAGAHVSGGHYNPAVTAAVLVRGRISVADAAGYWIAQVLAGVLAALAVRGVVADTSVTTTVSGDATARFLVEALFTFALCYVVVSVATRRDSPNNLFSGLAIGFTVATGAIAVGSISGGAFNPAVTLGVDTMGLLPWSNLSLYVVAQVLAGVLAALVFRALNPADS
jgi:aquaporin Z